MAGSSPVWHGSDFYRGGVLCDSRVWFRRNWWNHSPSCFINHGILTRTVSRDTRRNQWFWNRCTYRDRRIPVFSRRLVSVATSVIFPVSVVLPSSPVSVSPLRRETHCWAVNRRTDITVATGQCWRYGNDLFTCVLAEDSGGRPDCRCCHRR